MIKKIEDLPKEMKAEIFSYYLDHNKSKVDTVNYYKVSFDVLNTIIKEVDDIIDGYTYEFEEVPVEVIYVVTVNDESIQIEVLENEEDATGDILFKSKSIEEVNTAYNEIVLEMIKEHNKDDTTTD